jgi:hypothetical protein
VAKSAEPPSFPIAFVVASLAVVADLGGLVALFLFHLPIGFKAAVGFALVLIPCVALGIYVGERRQWIRGRGIIRELERELEELREEPARIRARRAA